LQCSFAAVECAWAGVGGAVLVIGMHQMVCHVCWLVVVLSKAADVGSTCRLVQSDPCAVRSAALAPPAQTGWHTSDLGCLGLCLTCTRSILSCLLDGCRSVMAAVMMLSLLARRLKVIPAQSDLLRLIHLHKQGGTPLSL
jgi:hypothetical protein